MWEAFKQLIKRSLKGHKYEDIREFQTLIERQELLIEELEDQVLEADLEIQRWRDKYFAALENNQWKTQA